MGISAKLVKELREKTGSGLMECKKALQETSGDVDAAIKLLREKGIASAGKRSGRSTSEGMIEIYIHPGNRLGVMLEIGCETDFVARTDEFKALARDLAMHIAGAEPQFVQREDVPEAIVEAEKDIYLKQAENSNKPPQVIEKILTGKIDKFLSQICLLEQAFVKDTDKTISELVKESITKMGENIVIKRFARFKLGDE